MVVGERLSITAGPRACSDKARPGESRNTLGRPNCWRATIAVEAVTAAESGTLFGLRVIGQSARRT